MAPSLALLCWLLRVNSPQADLSDGTLVLENNEATVVNIKDYSSSQDPKRHMLRPRKG